MGSSGAGRSVALVYHRVVEGQRDPFELCVTPDQFAAHLDRVRAQATIVPLEDLLTPAAGPRVAITIDDGYTDALTDALPVLEAGDTPATVFVSTDTLEDGRVFWWDRLAALVYRASMTRSGRRRAISAPAAASSRRQTKRPKLCCWTSPAASPVGRRTPHSCYSFYSS